MSIKTMNIDEIKEFAEKLTVLLGALEGKPLDSEQIIRDLVDLKNLMERSRFPTYPILGRNVYFRLIAQYHPEASACKDYADHEAKGLIAYKGDQRKEIVEMKKHAQVTAPDQTIMYNPSTVPPEQKKRHFWQRKPKPETEFSNQ